MADPVFFTRRKFSKSKLEGRYQEEGVVAESPTASGPFQDSSFTPALGSADRAVWCCDYNDTPEACGPFFFWGFTEQVEEFGVVLCVGRFFARKTGRVDAGGAAERIHLQAGIIGQGRTTGMASDSAGLFDRVGLKGVPVFDDAGEVCEVCKGTELDFRAEDLADLFEFAGIAGGDDEGIHFSRTSS